MSTPEHIRKCSCTHKFQDEQYGKQMRLHTQNKAGEWRCTVCSPSRRTSRLAECARNWIPAFNTKPIGMRVLDNGSIYIPALPGSK